MTDQEQLKSIAKQLVWWQEPEVSLANPRRFIEQVMTLGNWPQIQTVRDCFGDDALRGILSNPDKGVFDAKSWSYWHAFFGLAEGPLPGSSLK